MPNKIRAEVKVQLGFQPEMTDLEFFQALLMKNPGDLIMQRNVKKMQKAGKEWMDARGNPVD
jgi:hypothetical protein